MLLLRSLAKKVSYPSKRERWIPVLSLLPERRGAAKPSVETKWKGAPCRRAFASVLSLCVVCRYCYDFSDPTDCHIPWLTTAKKKKRAWWVSCWVPWAHQCQKRQRSKKKKKSNESIPLGNCRWSQRSISQQKWFLNSPLAWLGHCGSPIHLASSASFVLWVSHGGAVLC